MRKLVVLPLTFPEILEVTEPAVGPPTARTVAAMVAREYLARFTAALQMESLLREFTEATVDMEDLDSDLIAGLISRAGALLDTLPALTEEA